MNADTKNCTAVLPRAHGRSGRAIAAGAEETLLTGILGGKASYYADFGLYAILLIVLVSVTLPAGRPARWAWALAAIAGAAGWTLIEYLLHRFVFHGVPLIAALHHAHHLAPRAHISTPTWVSLSLLGGLLFLPIWRLFSLNLAFGATTGLTAGWLWYGVAHHVIHHRRPRLLARALKAASSRHLLHHFPSVSGNFGVTTSLWDRVFGTHIPRRGSAARSRRS